MRIVTWLLVLYPRRWRERYAGEMIALLEQYNITFFTIFDLFVGALDARLDPHFKMQRQPIVNRSIYFAPLVFLCVFPVFFLAMIYWIWQIQDPPAPFYGLIDGINSSANGISPVSLLYSLLPWIFFLVVAAILINVLLMLAFTVKKVFVAQSMPRRYLLLLCVLVAVLSLGTTAFTILQQQHLNPTDAPWLLLALFTSIILGWLIKVPPPTERGTPAMGTGWMNRILFLPFVVGGAGMLLCTLVDLFWGVSLLSTLPSIAAVPLLVPHPFLGQENWLTAWLVDWFLLASTTCIMLFVSVRSAITSEITHQPSFIEIQEQKKL